MNGRSRIYHDMSALLHTPVQLASLMVLTHSHSEYFNHISFISALSNFKIQWVDGRVALCHAQRHIRSWFYVGVAGDDQPPPRGPILECTRSHPTSFFSCKSCFTLYFKFYVKKKKSHYFFFSLCRSAVLHFTYNTTNYIIQWVGKSLHLLWGMLIIIYVGLWQYALITLIKAHRTFILCRL